MLLSHLWHAPPDFGIGDALYPGAGILDKIVRILNCQCQQPTTFESSAIPQSTPSWFDQPKYEESIVIGSCAPFQMGYFPENSAQSSESNPCQAVKTSGEEI